MHRYSIFLLFLFGAAVQAGQVEYNLLEAVEDGDLAQMRELLAKGADVNQPQEPHQQTPIIIAPLRGIEVIKLLLAHGADINARDEVHNTALINAASYGRLEEVKFLLDHGADPKVVNKDGIDALEAARIAGHAAVIQLLQTPR